jgi:peptidoglycan/LPS O-acetylase OafA/YrhL
VFRGITGMGKNSLDLLRLVAAAMVLFSHQFAVLGLPEPQFLGLNTWGGVGVSIFFFLSGYLVWTSWARDPSLVRFFLRRCLRIFPALWVICLLSVLVLGPLVTVLSVQDYFGSAATWRYGWTALLWTPYVLPGVFAGNALPGIVNGSLWTLPAEFFCYCTVAVLGGLVLWMLRGRALPWSLGVLAAVACTHVGVAWIGARYWLYFEMIAMFWWGVFYGYCVKSWPTPGTAAIAVLALLWFAVDGPRGWERTVLLAIAAGAVHLCRQLPQGARLTDRIGDLSYGVYIYAFPVQQLVVHACKGYSLAFWHLWALSSVGTLALAWLSWHAVEARALRFKPGARGAG